MPITYQPYFRVHGTTTWTPFGQPTANTSVVISGLSPSTQYDFEIQAINAFGTATSTPVSAQTLSAVAITGISLSPQSFVAGSPIGTVVGTIAVTMSSGSFTGSLSITGTDAGTFKISGNQLQLAVANSTVKTYSINLVATMATVPTFTQAFPTIIGNSSIQESVEGFVVQGTDTTTIMYASTTRGVAQSSGPYLQFTMIPTNSNSINLLAPGQSLITTSSGSVSKIVYGKHTCFQTNTSVPPGWWYWDTSKPFGASNWNPFGINTLIGPSSYPSGATNNTVIGNITVTMLTSTDTFAGTLTVSDSTNSFKIVSGQLVATKTLSGSYTPTITAIPYTTTDASAQQLGSTLAITPTISLGGNRPPQPVAARNAGFNTLAFFDDFTDASKIALTTQIPQSTSFNWYLDGRSPANDVITTTMNSSFTAANTPGGSAGAGSAPSPAGGILHLLGVFPNATLMTLAPATYISVNGAPQPVAGQGCWGPHWYAEAYIRVVPGTSFTEDPTNFGWPAWWSWAASGIQKYNGNEFNLTANPTEIDFFETFGWYGYDGFGNISNKPSNAVDGWAMSLITHGSGSGGGEVLVAQPGGNTAGFPNAVDGNYHAYGCLWTPGTLTCYYDGAILGTISTANTAMETASQTFFLVLGTGSTWPMYVDYVWVWTA